MVESHVTNERIPALLIEIRQRPTRDTMIIGCPRVAGLKHDQPGEVVYRDHSAVLKTRSGVHRAKVAAPFPGIFEGIEAEADYRPKSSRGLR